MATHGQFLLAADTGAQSYPTHSYVQKRAVSVAGKRYGAAGDPGG